MKHKPATDGILPGTSIIRLASHRLTFGETALRSKITGWLSQATTDPIAAKQTAQKMLGIFRASAKEVDGDPILEHLRPLAEEAAETEHPSAGLIARMRKIDADLRERFDPEKAKRMVPEELFNRLAKTFADGQEKTRKDLHRKRLKDTPSVRRWMACAEEIQIQAEEARDLAAIPEATDPQAKWHAIHAAFLAGIAFSQMQALPFEKRVKNTGGRKRTCPLRQAFESAGGIQNFSTAEKAHAHLRELARKAAIPRPAIAKLPKDATTFRERFWKQWTRPDR